MGDQIGNAVSGKLYFVPYKEFKRILSLNISLVDKTMLFAALCRINTLYMIARAGSGHIGSSFSSMDIMSWLQLSELHTLTHNDNLLAFDIFFSSKGHDAPALYSIWIGLGKLEFGMIHRSVRLDGLPGHPDVSTPNVVTNTGSLGMGISKAKGMIFANRLHKKKINVYVLTGDGELQEGQFWESLISAANQRLQELIVIIDHNKLQSDTMVSKVNDLGDLEAKLLAFGWHVSRCDGNDISSFSKTLSSTKRVINKPKVIIADTIKGKGVSFIESTCGDSDVEYYKFHSGAPNQEDYILATQELIGKVNSMLNQFDANTLDIESVNRTVVNQIKNPQLLIQAYSNALIEQACKNPQIIALDADLILDTGLIEFKNKYPDRFIECGIAEQDMVSQAGGIALQGLLPVAHSFACFLTTRANEQIYNNATERKKIIYVGSLAGILPAGPGHSHQAVHDLSVILGIPRITIIEPFSVSQVGPLLEWAVNNSVDSTYMRLTSIPFDDFLDGIDVSKTIQGCGHILREGVDATVVATNPILIQEALFAADFLQYKGISLKVIATPWINQINTKWFSLSLAQKGPIFTLESHYLDNGFGSYFINSLIESGIIKDRQIKRIGLMKLPLSGANKEVLQSHGLDYLSIAKKINSFI